jgi:hypothetical protein
MLKKYFLVVNKFKAIFAYFYQEPIVSLHFLSNGGISLYSIHKIFSLKVAKLVTDAKKIAFLRSLNGFIMETSLDSGF